MVDLAPVHDVLVVGGGNAGLCAAISARQAGASVLLAERAPKEVRGGNARHSRNIRIMHREPTPFTHGTYTEAEYWRDLERVTGNDTDAPLARRLIDESAGIVDWLAASGVRFQLTGDGILPPSRKTAFLLGGGTALVNALYAEAARLGVDVRYGCDVRSLSVGNGAVQTATILRGETEEAVRARSVIVCTGGYQGDIDWLRASWGDAADQFVIRGTPHATGTVLRDLLDAGAAPIGDPGRCHMVAVDARAPTFDGGIVTRLDGIPFGIVVDREGRRFHDEGAHLGSSRYSAWGDLVAACPGQLAYAIFDSETEHRFRPSIFPAIRADSVAELAVRLGIDPATLDRTVWDFNAAIRPGPAGPDSARTEGIAPPKTRLAFPIAVPPFGCYPVRPGITSTFLGVGIDAQARVVMADGRSFANLFAAGVIMAGNILRRGYLAGSAMTIGAVFGRIAGREAAAHAIR